MPHLILLGDSIFDNARYTNGGPDVVKQVRRLLPQGWKATLLAIDGSVADDVPRQAGRIPADATHLVLSVGGNDALHDSSIIEARVTSVGQALGLFANVSDKFGRSYADAVEACLGRGLPLALCTIYNGCFPDQIFQRIATVAVMVFNDVIVRAAIEHALPIIDLRRICSLPEDYANPIEPSSVGGEKIARGIVDFALGGRPPITGPLGAPRDGKIRGAPERPASHHPYAFPLASAESRRPLSLRPLALCWSPCAGDGARAGRLA
jgi:hypothetical protein